MDPMRVLIVDDETELVSALVERLDLRGIDADGLNDGAAALSQIEQTAYDVVLLDLKMPGMDGIEVIRRMHDKQPELKIILLTGQCDAETTERGKASGAWECLVKPVSIDQLLTVLKKAAGR